MAGNNTTIQDTIVTAQDVAKAAFKTAWDGELCQIYSNAAALRAVNGTTQKLAYIVSLQRFFERDSNDTTSQDNGSTVIHDGDGNIWKAVGISGASSLAKARVVDTTGLDPDTEYQAGDTVDGVTLAENDLILRAEPSGNSPDTREKNGLYLAAASGSPANAATRHSDFDTFDKLAGTYFSVMEGTAKADTLWRVTSDQGGGTLDTDPVVMEEFAGGSGYSKAEVDGEDGNIALSAGFIAANQDRIPLPLWSEKRWRVVNEPILEPTAGEWDSDFIIDPAILWDDANNRVAVSYSGNNGTSSRMGIAFGPDIYNLTKYASNPILSLGSAGEFDESDAYDGQVFEWNGDLGHSEKYAILYVGLDSSSNYGWGLSFSDDLETWTKYASNPIITDATFESEAQDPRAILVNGTWHIFYEYTSGGGDKVLGHMTTTDWSSFTVDLNNPIATSSAGDIEDPQILWFDNEWHLLGERPIGGKRTIFHATNTSPDSWGQDPGEALIRPYGKAGEEVASLSYYWHRGRWYMACTGRRTASGPWSLFAIEERPISPAGTAVVAELSAQQTGISEATWTKLDFDTQILDYMDEFDTTNNKFVADGAKTVEVNAQVTSDNVNVIDGTFMTLRLMHQSTRISSARVNSSGSSQLLQAYIHRIVEMADGDELQIDVHISGTNGSGDAAVKDDNGYTSLSIKELS